MTVVLLAQILFFGALTLLLYTYIGYPILMFILSRVYALPVTQNLRGSNEYIFRLRLNIPSDASFPVFDITVKLPPEVAARAGSEQWYKEITINKKPIKNEGRFRITAPRAETRRRWIAWTKAG